MFDFGIEAVRLVAYPDLFALEPEIAEARKDPCCWINEPLGEMPVRYFWSVKVGGRYAIYKNWKTGQRWAYIADLPIEVRARSIPIQEFERRVYDEMVERNGAS